MISPELSRYTGYLVRRAQQVHAALWQLEVGAKVTSVQFGVLSLLHLHPGIDQRSLGQLLQLDRSTITDLVLRLENRGYLSRELSSTDRRRRILNLTDMGRAQLESVWEHADNVNEALVSGLGDADRAELNRLLQLLLSSQVAQRAIDVGADSERG